MGKKPSDTSKSQIRGEPRENEFCDDNNSDDEAFKPRKARSKKEPSAIPSQSVSYSNSEKRTSNKKKSVSSDTTQNLHEAVHNTMDGTSNRKKMSSKKEKKIAPEPCERVNILHEQANDTTDNSFSVLQSRNKKSKGLNVTAAEESGKKACKPDKSASSDFCPICQVPLNILKISAATHTSSCAVSGDSGVCPDGSACLNSNLFHYRDFIHHELAAFRISEDYIEPDVIFTPKKLKSKTTPTRTSAGKKRPSKSPMASSAKLPKMDDPCHSEELSCTEPDVLCDANRTDETRKRLFTEDFTETEINNHSDKNNIQVSSSGSKQNGKDSCAETEIDTQQSSEVLDSLVQSELWCSDLIFSEGTTQPEILPNSDACTEALKIKSDPESENIVQVDALMPTASSANVTIHYDETSNRNEQDLVRNQVECSENCRQNSKFSNVLQANCSVLVKATGVNREEAMSRSPLTVTLMINSSGWEALEIKGNTSTNVHKIEVSVCQCSHSMCVECQVNNSDVLEDIKFDPLIEQEEKFFSTLGDMGLKTTQVSVQTLHNNALERKKLLLNNCSQVGLVVGNATTPSLTSNESTVSSDNEIERNAESAEPEEPVRVVDAFALLKRSAASERPGTPTASLFSSGGTSRSSTPTPVPMVVSKTTGSSWTLLPAKVAQGGRAYGAISKKVPAYKRIPGTPFVVDAFNYGVIPGAKVYFLSHFHSDHYIGLKKDFNLPIFCSQVTANLVHLKIRVDKKYLHILKIGEPRVICGVEVEVFDANHCPGAVMILFRLLDGRTMLHVGDFRAHPSMEENSQLRHVDKLYLDTTYCDPAYDFPYQEEVVLKVVQTVRDHLLTSKSTLIVCGTYTIGKEKVFMGIAEATNFKIWTTGEKRKVLQCLEDKNLLNRLTNDPYAAQIHVLAMRDISLEELFEHLKKYNRKYSHVVGFKPTGWTTSTSIKGKPSDFQKSSRDKVTIYGVPYSEHSSFSELRRFVRYVRPKDIQVTVNLGKSAQYKKMFEQWLSSNRDGDGQSKVLQYFTSSSRHSSH